MLKVIALCAALVGPMEEPKALTTRVITASVFKPGIALIMREAVPVSAGRHRLDVVPEAIDGTFWPASDGQAQVGDVITRLRTVTKKVKVTAEGFADYLEANVGQKVTMRIARGNEEPERIAGVIERVSSPPGLVASIRQANGNLRLISPSTIQEMETKGLKREFTRSVPYPQVEVEVEVIRPGRIRFMTLERGAAWTGSYLVQLSRARARVTAKAQLAVGALTLPEADVRVLSGLPTLQNLRRFDLVSGIGSLREYVSGRQDSVIRHGPRDPFEQLGRMIAEAEQRLRGYYGYYGNSGGGFGAGGFGGSPGGSYSQESESQSDSAPNLAVRSESVYSYQFGKVSMRPGDRLTRMLFTTEAPERTLLQWKGAATGPGQGPFTQAAEFNQIVRLKNEGTAPWTAGSAFVLKDEIPLATLDMPFTPAGAEADLIIGTVQDVIGLVESVEIERSKNLVFHVYREVTTETKFTVENTRDEAVEIEIVHSLAGEVLSAEGAEVKALATHLKAVNKNMRVVWRASLPAKGKREFMLRAKTLVS